MLQSGSRKVCNMPGDWERLLDSKTLENPYSHAQSCSDSPVSDSHIFPLHTCARASTSQYPSHANPNNFVRNGEAVGEIEGYSCQIVADEGIRWIEQQQEVKNDQPFFLYLAFHESHEPVPSPPELVDKYMDGAKTKEEATYLANVENVDLAVGKVLAKLSVDKKYQNITDQNIDTIKAANVVEFEVYDLAKDIGESNNLLIAKPKSKTKLKKKLEIAYRELLNDSHIWTVEPEAKEKRK